MALKARVENGRLTLSVPTSLPDGTELQLVLDDGKDGMDDAEREELLAALDEGLADADARKVVPASEVLASLRR